MYEANLSPSDCRLFPAMKQNLGCHVFEDNREMITVLTQWLITLDRENIQLVPRSDKCLNCGEYNVENLWYSSTFK